ncbi:MAG: PQQ-dependent sugar dehydrogenase [Bdellovibrionota bacterium]
MNKMVLVLVVACLVGSRTYALIPAFEGEDKQRKAIKIDLEEVVSRVDQPTDIQFLPGRASTMIVAEKTGKLRWFRLGSRQSGTLVELAVNFESEMGLLGVAFHPKFSNNRKVYLHYNPAGRVLKSRISEWVFANDSSGLSNERVLLEVGQPFSNHKAGQIAFGPDSFLYIGFGDGGSGGDPHRNGQNTKTFLGKMIRIDVDRPAKGRPYSIPKDNPFINSKDVLPEIWAIGLRNPWRFSFDPRGRLVVADVGQNRFEEISIIERGKNYGWNIKEASQCYDNSAFCKSGRFEDPVIEYAHPPGGGASITGGYVYAGNAIQELKNKYVYTDFILGKIWAAHLPEKGFKGKPEVYALGKWPILPATFGRDSFGELYLGDFKAGKIYKLKPKGD